MKKITDYILRFLNGGNIQLRLLWSLVLILILLCPVIHTSNLVNYPKHDAYSKGMVIEDFEDGVVILTSYSDEDIEPSAWELESSNTYDSSNYALRLYGNTWKLEEIEPCSLKAEDVWRVAAYIEEQAEIQGFGLVDSSNVLLYAFGGTHLLNPDYWITVYQGAFSQAEWHTYLLPVAQDWEDWYGYIPVITGLVYLNDRDYIDQGITIFDEIFDITEDLPIPPEVEIQYTSGRPERNSMNKLVVNVQFYAIVFDPDSDTFNFYWDFGDGDTSTIENPSHEFVVLDDHSYTVRLEVVDTDVMWGRDTCRIDVDPGPTTFPLTINFVGDIMLARRYEQPGGIIPTYGVEYIFEPTLGIYGEAAEISVCNLENLLTDEGEPHPTKPIIFRSSPENVDGLVHAGIDVVSL
ncbi:CapA family protein, partial [candidate division WOR-3 bacterium]|nr:CapA family protein [candidate division WOR-3 bacterium]